MRIMYDAISATNVPADGDLYAGYDDGYYADATAMQARFPTKRIIKVTAFATDNEGDVIDCETGDATPAQVPGWLTRRRATGADPSVYCSELGINGIAAVERACVAANVHFDRAHWWRANYNGKALLEIGESAHQWIDTGPYDMSVVADYWPGIDLLPKGTDMRVVRDTGTGREYLQTADGALWYLGLTADVQAYANSLGAVVELSSTALKQFPGY